MEKILIDTDVLIDFLRGYRQRIKGIFASIEKKEITACVSSVSIVELYSGRDSQDEEKKAILGALTSYLEIVFLDTAGCKLAGDLKRKYDLSVADSIIAATSIKENLKLWTFNTKHFLKIKELSLFKTDLPLDGA